MPVRGARRRAVLTVDDPPATNRARIAARHPRHSHDLVLRKDLFALPRSTTAAVTARFRSRVTQRGTKIMMC
ncbi:hypothetical protein BGY98DRAFT_1021378, partial [Russula aff. rugulosa BPL654]